MDVAMRTTRYVDAEPTKLNSIPKNALVKNLFEVFSLSL
jgi:hypothetical protein